MHLKTKLKTKKYINSDLCLICVTQRYLPLRFSRETSNIRAHSIFKRVLLFWIRSSFFSPSFKSHMIRSRSRELISGLRCQLQLCGNNRFDCVLVSLTTFVRLPFYNRICWNKKSQNQRCECKAKHQIRHVQQHHSSRNNIFIHDMCLINIQQ